ncbi:MAG: glutaredoxin family protein [Actinobacteria bacterium]|nr:glutaredoxin family protein [Actinomycetota bacterium]
MGEPLPPQLARVMVLSKPGCHLCEQVEQAVARVCAQTGDTWAVVLTQDHPELADAYAYEVPVIFVDGTRHDYWRVDETRLRAALSGQS